jgi:hypothetical protein
LVTALVIFGLDPEIHVSAAMAGSNLIAMGPRVKPEDDYIYVKTGTSNWVLIP